MAYSNTDDGMKAGQFKSSTSPLILTRVDKLEIIGVSFVTSKSLTASRIRPLALAILLRELQPMEDRSLWTREIKISPILLFLKEADYSSSQLNFKYPIKIKFANTILKLFRKIFCKAMYQTASV